MSSSMSISPVKDDGTNVTPKNTRGITSKTGIFNSSDLKVAAHFVDGSNILTDGGFEVWTDPNTLTNWSFTDFTTGSGAVVQTQNSTSPQAGTYSVRHVGTYVADQLSGLTIQAKSSLTPGATYRSRVYSKLVSGAGSAVLILLNNANPGTATQVLNWSSFTWEAWTGTPGANQTLALSATGSWVATTASNTFPVPASGTIAFGLLSSGDPGSSYTMDFDSVELFPSTYVAANTVSLFSFSNPSDQSILQATDTGISFGTTGGTPFNLLTQNPNTGAFTTDFSTFDFSAKPVKVGNATAITEALNYYTSEGIIASKSSVNFASTGTTTLWTNNSGKTAVITKVILRPATKTNATVDGLFKFGTNNPNYDNWNAAITIPYTITTTGSFPIANTGNQESVANGDVFKVNVSTAITADAFTGSIDVIGYYLP